MQSPCKAWGIQTACSPTSSSLWFGSDLGCSRNDLTMMALDYYPPASSSVVLAHRPAHHNGSQTLIPSLQKESGQLNPEDHRESRRFQVSMAEEGAILKITRNLKDAVSAILQGYGDGQGPVTDTSAELHRLCGCLELLLQFDQKEQRSFLGTRKDYWDFLCTALRRHRGHTEQTRFVCSQDKLKTSLGKGRAFIRLCLAHGQLAESMQLCLLSPDLTREWYGPRSPLLCPELQEDILDSLYALNGVAFNLDLQRPDLDEAWPMFSESRCSNPRQTQERRPRKPRGCPKEVSCSRGEQLQGPDARGTSCLQDGEDHLPGLPTPLQHGHLPTFLEQKKGDPRSLSCPQSIWETEGEGFELDQKEGGPKNRKSLENSAASSQPQREGAKEAQREVTGEEDEGKGSLSVTEGQRTTEGTQEKAADGDHDQGLLTPSLQGRVKDTALGNRQGWDQPSVLGQPWILQSPGGKNGSPTEKPQEWTRVTSVSRLEDQAEVSMQEVAKDPTYGLRLAKEQAQRQEQLLRAQEEELQALQEQLVRCQAERAHLQVMLEQTQQEAERRDAMREKELEGQRDLVQAMKRRVLELIHEKDHQWQRLQQLSSVAPGHCVGCNKVFRRLSRRYPCRLCGSSVCHACSVDYKKREQCCPACAQREEIQVT
ncbi:RUN and FYVE domain-containing protein 4 isoform X4 [Peromyscus leucopus]|uniref:RUN and FYVE domain-containing protein 4 isoform X4 n=2 Tax=Peromyscus leucopus TaxID=10041 RepID=UPI0018853BC4|nr:RUN and FYVE domain-containing protein 4 isoform X4 [Peromyscus leucopus]